MTCHSGATSLRGLGTPIRGFRFPNTTPLGVTTGDSHALGQFIYFLFGFPKGRGESHNLGVFLVGIDPCAIMNYVLIPLVELTNDLRRRFDVLHDPIILKPVNEDQELFHGRGANSTKNVCDEALIRVGCCARLGMGLLEDVDHSSGEGAHIILASRPEADFAELLFKVTDLDDRLRLGHLKHLPEKKKPAVYHVVGLLIHEREVSL